MNTPTNYTQPKSFGQAAAELYKDRMKTAATMAVTHPGFRLANLPPGEQTGRAVWDGPGGSLYTSHSTSTSNKPVLTPYRPRTDKGGYKKSHNNKNKKGRKTKTRKSKKRKF